MNKIEIKDLSKVFKSGEDNLEVFNVANLVFKDNETIAIKGASGSGKSTFLQIIAGLDKPTTGEVKLTGTISESLIKKESCLISNLKERHLNKLRKNNFGFIYQKHFLLKDLNVLDNLLIVNNDKKKALELLKEVELEDKKDRFHNQLSGGEKQRVSICRALMNSPKFVFADEPTGSLDYNTKEKIWNLFEKLRIQHNFGLIMVTHDTLLAEKCQNIYVFNEGKIHKEK